MSYSGHRRRNKGESFRDQDIEGQQLKNGYEAGEKEFWNDEGDSPKISRTLKKIIEPPHVFTRIWRIIFGVSCVIAISMDPLFLYVLVINEDKKCIGLDKKLRNIAIIFRSVNDIIGVINIILQFYNGFKDETYKPIAEVWKIARRHLWPYLLIDILVILPFPQVVILFYFRELKGSKSLKRRNLSTSFVLLQYVPRVVQIYLSLKDPMRRAKKFFSTPIWVKAAFNFLLYIIASHVLGAFWYFLSIERETACWYKACENKECSESSFNCDHSLGNYTFLNDFCIISPPNTTPNTTFFDFGIFLGALNSGVVQSKNFSEKFFQCFWWGLRNLSSFGQNLQISSHIWEGCFTVLISLLGLLLFSYFIGNLQLYMQLEDTKLKKKRKKAEDQRKERKQEIKKIQSWMNYHNIKEETKKKIMRAVECKLKAKEHICVENLLSQLPPQLGNDLKRHICLNLLKDVPILQNKDVQLLHKICDSLKPVYYDEHCYMVLEGDPINATFLITRGIAWTYSTSNGAVRGSSLAERLVRGHFFGKELLELVLEDPQLLKLPVSQRTIKTNGQIEAFTITDEDLKNIFLEDSMNSSREQSKKSRSSSDTQVS